MLKKILIGFAIVIVVLLIVVLLQPSTFKVTRSVAINAPPSVVFPIVNDFHRWNEWSPWEKLDPNMKKTFDAQTYAWEGNKAAGAGKMTMLKSQPNELIQIKLDFLKPFESTALTEFSFAGDAKNSRVTWTMSGENNFMARAFGLVMSMDKLVGGDFEKGLAALKQIAESSVKK